MIGRLVAWFHSAARSDFGRNVAWSTALSGFERLIAVVQTVLISRALGISEYGAYGLLFGTIGFVASIVGLQMGLTATVFVSKYRETDKPKAAAVISIVSRFGLIVAAAFATLALPFSKHLSGILMGSDRYQVVVIVASIFVGATILSGIQDGVAQGFEIFQVLAKIKLAVSAAVLASIHPVARTFGLNGVLTLILGGVVLKFLLLQLAVGRCRADARIPASGAGVTFPSLVNDFALPSMAVSLLLGFVTWLGMFLLSRQSGGFGGVAIVSTGLQWRGPVLLLAASLGGVAVPAFSRLSALGDVEGSRRLRRQLAVLNFSIASAAAIAVIASSTFVMSLYGAGFAEGRLPFSLIVLSTVPMVVANVFMQELVGAGRMWRQLWLHCPFLAAMFFGFVFLIPHYRAVGYSLSLLLGSVVLLASVLVAGTMEKVPHISDIDG